MIKCSDCGEWVKYPTYKKSCCNKDIRFYTHDWHFAICDNGHHFAIKETDEPFNGNDINCPICKVYAECQFMESIYRERYQGVGEL